MEIIEEPHNKRQEVIAMPFIRVKCWQADKSSGWPTHVQVLPPIGATVKNADGTKAIVNEQVFLVDGTIELVLD